MLSKSSLAKTFVRVTLVLLVLLALLYLLIPYYVPPIARLMLANTGVQLETLVVVRPRGLALRAPQLQLLLPELGRVQLDGLSLARNAQKRFILKIARARVVLAPAMSPGSQSANDDREQDKDDREQGKDDRDQGNETSKTGNLSELLPSAVLQSLPSGLVSVAQLTIDAPERLPEPLVLTSFVVEKLPDHLRASAALKDSRETLRFAAAARGNGEFDFSLHLASSPESPLSAQTRLTLQRDTLQWQGNITGEAAVLNGLIRRFGPGETMLTDDTRLALHIRAAIADSPSDALDWSSLRVALQASGTLAWQDALALHGDVGLNLTMGASGGALRLNQAEAVAGSASWPLEHGRRADIGFRFTPLALSFDAALDAPLSWSNIRLSEPASAAFTQSGQPLGSVALAELTYAKPTGPMRAIARADLHAPLAQLLMPDNSVSLVEEVISLDVTLESSGETSALTLKAPLEATLNVASLTQSGFAPLAVTLPPQVLHISAWGERVDNLLLNFRGRYLEPAVDFRGKAGVVLNGQVLNVLSNIEPMLIAGSRWPGMTAHAEIKSVDANSSAASFSVYNLCGEALINGTWHDDGREAVTTVRAQRQFTADDGLRQWLNNETLPLGITAGEFTLDFHRSEVHGQAPVINMSARLNDGLGHYPGGGKFSGIQFLLSSVPLSSTELAQQALRFALQAEAAEINLGVPFTNVLANAELLLLPNKTSVSLQRLTAEVFDGSVTLAPQRFALDETIELQVDIHSLDLGQVVATQQVEGLTATGKLSGGLPFTFNGGSLSVNDGNVGNLSGGLIRFQSPLLGNQDLNPQLKLTLNVLQNFNYDLLDSKVDFVDGTLRLKSKLSGKNPDVADGQRVDLNLNTEIDTVSAVAFMRLQAGIEASLEKFVSREFGDDPLRKICTERNPL